MRKDGKKWRMYGTSDEGRCGAQRKNESKTKGQPSREQQREGSSGKTIEVLEGGGVYSRADPGARPKEATADCGASSPCIGLDVFKKSWRRVQDAFRERLGHAHGMVGKLNLISN